MAGDDARPPIWVGHVTLRTPELAATHDFMIQLGMRDIARGEDFGVLELRGGTHLVLLPNDQFATGPTPFDLMVDDLEATHRELAEKGLEPSEIEQGRIHRSFTIACPSGHTVKFNSTHVSDRPV